MNECVTNSAHDLPSLVSHLRTVCYVQCRRIQKCVHDRKVSLRLCSTDVLKICRSKCSRDLRNQSTDASFGSRTLVCLHCARTCVCVRVCVCVCACARACACACTCTCAYCMCVCACACVCVRVCDLTRCFALTRTTHRV